jgi:hypothetical protein
MRAIPVDRKLSTTSERRQDQYYLFRRVDYRNEDQNLENLSWIRVLVKMFLCSETKNGAKTKVVSFG